MTIYSTTQGDTYDYIGHVVYGSGGEGFMDIIAQANPPYMSTVIFDADVELFIPDKPVTPPPSRAVMPPWRA